MKLLLRRLSGDEGGLGDFLMGVSLFAFVAFFPLDIAVPLQRLWALQHIKAQILDQVVWEGQIPADVMERVQAAAGSYPLLDPSQMTVGPATTTPGLSVQFGESITLQIGYPRGRLITAKLIGLAWDPDEVMWVHGTVHSQRPWR